MTRAFFVQAEAGPSLLVVGERYVLDGPPSTPLYTSPDVSARAALAHAACADRNTALSAAFERVTGVPPEGDETADSRAYELPAGVFQAATACVLEYDGVLVHVDGAHRVGRLLAGGNPGVTALVVAGARGVDAVQRHALDRVQPVLDHDRCQSGFWFGCSRTWALPVAGHFT